MKVNGFAAKAGEGAKGRRERRARWASRAAAALLVAVAEGLRAEGFVQAGHQRAFTEPIELGQLSYLAPKFLKQWPWVLACGVACFLAGVSVRWRRRAD